MSALVLSDNDIEQNKVSAFRTKLILSGLVTGGAVIAATPAHAQSTTIDVAGVSAQASAATTAITAVGVTLLAMAFGLLVFSVATNVIRRVMGG